MWYASNLWDAAILGMRPRGGGVRGKPIGDFAFTFWCTDHALKAAGFEIVRLNFAYRWRWVWVEVPGPGLRVTGE